MKDPRREYEATKTQFIPGNRFYILPKLVYWGKTVGMSADEIIADNRENDPMGEHDANIRRLWRSTAFRSYPSWQVYNRRQPHPSRTAKPKSTPTYPHYVRDMVAAGGGEATSADLFALSPFATARGGRAQTTTFLSSIFAPDDLLHIFRDDTPTTGKPGINLIPCREWLIRLERGDAMPGDLIVPNPFTGREGETTDGRKSYIAQTSLARFPFLVVEFDSMPLKVQAAFWCGMLSLSPLASHVAAITYSGGKSLHGLLHVGCTTLVDWRTVQDRLCGLLAADPDPIFKADKAAMRPRTGTRLPGVRRFNTGKLQELLYLDPQAVRV